MLLGAGHWSADIFWAAHFVFLPALFGADFAVPFFFAAAFSAASSSASSFSAAFSAACAALTFSIISARNSFSPFLASFFTAFFSFSTSFLACFFSSSFCLDSRQCCTACMKMCSFQPGCSSSASMMQLSISLLTIFSASTRVSQYCSETSLDCQSFQWPGLSFCTWSSLSMQATRRNKRALCRALLCSAGTLTVQGIVIIAASFGSMPSVMTGSASSPACALAKCSGAYCSWSLSFIM
mmetsp:Transcript_21739/g.64778  ORF Transcript_21739/g.64778 Transcript_21739/m.64778 type:complete len:239 (+) Transcript_21739:172-888(+)